MPIQRWHVAIPSRSGSSRKTLDRCANSGDLCQTKTAQAWSVCVMSANEPERESLANKTGVLRINPGEVGMGSIGFGKSARHVNLPASADWVKATFK